MTHPLLHNLTHTTQICRQGCPNGTLPPARAAALAGLGNAERQLLRTAVERLGLSMRAYDKILRVALTITDLAGQDQVDGAALTEALSYRNLDRRWR